MEYISFDVIDKLTTVAIIIAIALSVITDKLVWHTRLKKAEARADRWESVAIEALTAGAMAGVRAAEVTADAVSSITDTSQE